MRLRPTPARTAELFLSLLKAEPLLSQCHECPGCRDSQSCSRFPGKPGDLLPAWLTWWRSLWQDKVYQFCCKDCCEDFKRLRGVVSQCEHCKQEKLLHEKIRFSGVEKNFCSEGTWGRHGRGRAPMPALAGGGEESMEWSRGETV